MHRKIWSAGDAGTKVSMIVLRDGKIIDVLMETADRYTLMRVSRQTNSHDTAFQPENRGVEPSCGDAT